MSITFTRVLLSTNPHTEGKKSGEVKRRRMEPSILRPRYCRVISKILRRFQKSGAHVEISTLVEISTGKTSEISTRKSRKLLPYSWYCFWRCKEQWKICYDAKKTCLWRQNYFSLHSYFLLYFESSWFQSVLNNKFKAKFLDGGNPQILRK